jgi:hypothetical protein
MIYEGTNAIQAIDFVMRKILKDGGKSLGILTQEIVAAVQGLDEAKFKKEKDLFNKVLLSAQNMMQQLSTYAKNNQYNLILQNCSDFLHFASQMIIGWKLLQSAVLADQKLATANPSDKFYYESKVTDFRVYCAHYLTHNLSVAKTITDYTDDVTMLEI